MIRPQTYYTVFCDNCGERLVSDDVNGWETQEEAEDIASDCDWEIHEDGRCYCPECISSMELDYEEEEE